MQVHWYFLSRDPCYPIQAEFHLAIPKWLSIYLITYLKSAWALQ